MSRRPSPARPKDADPGTMPVVAAVSSGFAGVAVTALGVALAARVPLNVGEQAAVGLVVVCGALSLVAARGLLDASPWAAVLGSLVAPVLTLLTTAGSVYALWTGAFPPYVFCAPPIVAVATLVCPFAIAPAIRSSRARAAFRGTSLLGAIDR